MSSSKSKSTKAKSKRPAASYSPSAPGGGGGGNNNPARSSGYLLTCDPPMKQFIIHLNDQKITDKKFILEDLDGTHLLIRGEAKDEISRKVDEWMDMVSRRACARLCVCVGLLILGILFYALCDFLACTVGVRFRIAGHHLIDTYMIPIVCFHLHLTVPSECLFLHREGRRKLGHIIGTMAQGPRASLSKKQYSILECGRMGSSISYNQCIEDETGL